MVTDGKISKIILLMSFLLLFQLFKRRNVEVEASTSADINLNLQDGSVSLEQFVLLQDL